MKKLSELREEVDSMMASIEAIYGKDVVAIAISMMHISQTYSKTWVLMMNLVHQQEIPCGPMHEIETQMSNVFGQGASYLATLALYQAVKDEEKVKSIMSMVEAILRKTCDPIEIDDPDSLTRTFRPSH